ISGALQREAVPLRILVEHLLAVAAAEIHRTSRELRAELHGRTVDDHSTDRVLRFDPDGGRGWLRLGVADLVAPAMLDDLGENAHRDLLGRHRADVEPRRRLQPAAPLRWHAALPRRSRITAARRRLATRLT